ncbi:AAA family ATPase [candidate division KSB1 bacterium]
MILHEYLNEFKIHAKKWFDEVAIAKEYYQFHKEFFQKEKLKQAKWKNFQKIGDHIHSMQSVQLAKKRALGKQNHTLKHYRESFLYLVYGTDDIETRIRNFLTNKKYSLFGFGESITSELLGNIFADKFMFYNERDEFALNFLNVKPSYESSDDFTDRYLKYNESVKSVVEAYNKIVGSQTDLPINIEVDQFFSWLYETYKDKAEPPVQPGIRYWVIAPGRDASAWDEFRTESTIGIGWESIGDLKRYSDINKVKKALGDFYPGTNQMNNAHACWSFANEIKQGDYVLAKQGRSRILGFGEVKSDYIFYSSRHTFKHIRKVQWISTGDWTLPKGTTIPVKTLTEVTINQKFLNFILPLVANNGGGDGEKSYWWLNANPKQWKLTDYKPGELQTYTTNNEKGHKRQKYKYFLEAKPGDVVIGYITSPFKVITTLCEITKGVHETPEGPSIEFKLNEHLSSPVSFNDLKMNPELQECEPIRNNQGSLFRVTQEEFEIIQSIIDELNPHEPDISPEKYFIKNALEDLFMSENAFKDLLNLLKHRKNIILQGAPGVGKTFIAKRLAFSLMGFKDENRVSMIQFHQSYSYEDFMQGYRPQDDGSFKIKNGVFFKFCTNAARYTDKPFVFIIDEINRGNLSKIFGELMMLIEADKRGIEYAIPLTYRESNEEKFYIPPNVYLIGTMNTADRSLAMVDYALRRRFSFYTLDPQFKSDKFNNFLKKRGVKSDLIKKIVENMSNVNDKIAKDEKNLGPHFCIGHSFFCPENDEEKLDEHWYDRVVKYEIVPLIEEYWFDNQQEADTVKKLLE